MAGAFGGFMVPPQGGPGFPSPFMAPPGQAGAAAGVRAGGRPGGAALGGAMPGGAEVTASPSGAAPAAPIPQFSPAGLLPYNQALVPPALLWMLRLQQYQQAAAQHMSGQVAAAMAPAVAGPAAPTNGAGGGPGPAPQSLPGTAPANPAAGGKAAGGATPVKRPRLVWTQALHQRFVEAVKSLGDRKAVPKNIMQHMAVEGLTRENVASHLQKYRLYMKRQRGEQQSASPPEGSEDKAKDAAKGATAKAEAKSAPLDEGVSGPTGAPA